jgi:Resolvase, N terminal domain
MNRAIERRLVKVERRLAPPNDEVAVFIITGGICIDDGTTAYAGSLNWTQGPDESFSAFKARDCRCNPGRGASCHYRRASWASSEAVNRAPTRHARLAEAEVFEIVAEFIEIETGKGADALERRPQLAAALAEARRLKCSVVVSKLDRLSRDVHFISGLMAHKVLFIVAELGRQHLAPQLRCSCHANYN